MCLFSRVLRDSTPHFVSPLVRPSVCPSVCPPVCPSMTLFFLGSLRSLASLLLWPQIQPLPTCTRLGQPCVWPCSLSLDFTKRSLGASRGCKSKLEYLETRPDTRQSSRGRLGRSNNAKTARNFRNISDGRTDGRADGRTDRHGKV